MTICNEVFIDPPSPAYYRDELFNISNPVLNREDTLLPFWNLRNGLQVRGVTLRTADYLLDAPVSSSVKEYYSLGVLSNFQALANRGDVKLKAFVLLEPPVVDPGLYQALPDLSEAFDAVYLHNLIGDGYSLNAVDASRLRKLYWPQSRDRVIEEFWGRDDRQNRFVVINGNHKPKKFAGELYSKRIEAMVDLAPAGVVDLYGRGWERWFSRASMWAPYWLNRRVLMSVYRGACVSKYEVLSRYNYSLCFENMSMSGYITEKIFDCFYAGTVPVYLGGEDISSFVPADCFIDARQFSSWPDMARHVLDLSETKRNEMRSAGREFVESVEGKRYLSMMPAIFGLDQV